MEETKDETRREAKYVSHPLIKAGTIEAREYQTAILETAKQKNTLCVLPTGTGKTNIAILLAAERLQEQPNGNILIMAPTRPLCAQHQSSFRRCLNIEEERIALLTGKIHPQQRQKIYENATVIIATPQTIENDLRSGALSLRNFSLLVVDEVHRAVKRYAYPFVAKNYVESTSRQRILGLTASPGSSKEKIDEICKNLFIEAVEIRTEADADVSPYIKEINIEAIRVDLTENMEAAQKNLKSALKQRLAKLGRHQRIYSKKDLLLAQKRISRLMLLERKPIYYHAISLISETIKLWHLLELLETQSISAAKKYSEKLKIEKTKSSKRLLADENVSAALALIEKMFLSGQEHPKIELLKQIIQQELSENQSIKIIVFSHYRDNIELIKNVLAECCKLCRPAVLIGQAKKAGSSKATSISKGLSQKEQIDIIKDYEGGAYNCLITSPIGEEGLHIASADLAIFYEPVASEIRTIQRRGRVGRTKFGKIIFLLTRKTRDEINYWAAARKEKAMKHILREMQRKRTIKDFV